MLTLNLVQFLAWCLGSFLLGWGAIAYSLRFGQDSKAKFGFNFYKFFQDFKLTKLFETLWKLVVNLIREITFGKVVLEDLPKK